ncbi:MAG: hypothetical protein K5790_10225 [Nitrosopumilus sp.]|uniref:hypothetical protein n=1 Tax=Nitrosopumilus sp. TaxID=2024843 RepID=UPI00247BBF12|nr:hypothetical protein [Nitrosopumilus sp.]MCV0393645.1 hypothetical protein [Nitrosopumilus sp.]
MKANYLGLFTGFVLLVFILFPVDALGQTNSKHVDSPLGWKIGTFLDDLYIDVFVTDDTKKAEAIAKQAEKTQEQIESLAIEGKPIPNDYVKRVSDKTIKAQEILLNLEKVPVQGQEGIRNALKQITSKPEIVCVAEPCEEAKDVNSRINTGRVLETLQDVNEANQIRLLVNDFNELRDGINSGRFDTVTAETRANQIDSRANSLDLIIQHCDGRISSLDLAFEKSPYSILQNQCKILQNHSLEDAQNRLKLLGSDIE